MNLMYKYFVFNEFLIHNCLLSVTLQLLKISMIPLCVYFIDDTSIGINFRLPELIDT